MDEYPVEIQSAVSDVIDYLKVHPESDIVIMLDHLGRIAEEHIRAAMWVLMEEGYIVLDSQLRLSLDNQMKLNLR